MWVPHSLIFTEALIPALRRSPTTASATSLSFKYLPVGRIQNQVKSFRIPRLGQELLGVLQVVGVGLDGRSHIQNDIS